MVVDITDTLLLVIIFLDNICLILDIIIIMVGYRIILEVLRHDIIGAVAKVVTAAAVKRVVPAEGKRNEAAITYPPIPVKCSLI